jgi:chaperonin GroES
MEVTPLFDRVLLKPYLSQKSNTLITPLEHEGNKMVVVETGTNDNFIVKKGDIVIINKYSGSEFTLNNTTYILIKECDILGLIKENN